MNINKSTIIPNQISTNKKINNNESNTYKSYIITNNEKNNNFLDNTKEITEINIDKEEIENKNEYGDLKDAPDIEDDILDDNSELEIETLLKKKKKRSTSRY